MTFFDKIFRNTQSTSKAEDVTVDRDLFVYEEDPQETSQPEKASRTHLENLLSFDYETCGFTDGYDDHRISIMQSKSQSIIAEFRQALVTEIDVVVQHMRSIEPHLCDAVKEAMPSEYLNLNSKYSDLSTRKAELQAQCELASSSQGICELALSNYKLGFQKGFSLWTDEHLLQTNPKR